MVGGEGRRECLSILLIYKEYILIVWSSIKYLTIYRSYFMILLCLDSIKSL